MINIDQSNPESSGATLLKTPKRTPSESPPASKLKWGIDCAAANATKCSDQRSDDLDLRGDCNAAGLNHPSEVDFGGLRMSLDWCNGLGTWGRPEWFQALIIFDRSLWVFSLLPPCDVYRHARSAVLSLHIFLIVNNPPCQSSHIYCGIPGYASLK